MLPLLFQNHLATEYGMDVGAGVWSSQASGRACGQAKLLDQIRTHQIIAATSINNDTCSTVADDEENLEQVMAL